MQITEPNKKNSHNIPTPRTKYNPPKQKNKGADSLPDERVEKQLHAASDWEQDSHRDREKRSAVTQAGLSRATTSRPSARKTHSRAISLKGRNTYTSFTDILFSRGTRGWRG